MDPETNAEFSDSLPAEASAQTGGRPTGLPDDIAALFPDSFENSELGEIPKGWEVKTLGGMSIKLQYGYTASAQDTPVGPKFLRIKDINKSPWIDWDEVPYCEITDGKIEKYLLQPGDIVIARIADPGHAALIEEEVHSVFASYLIRFRLVDRIYARYFQYWFRSDPYWPLVSSRQSGSTRPNLNAKVLSLFPVIVPPRQIAGYFQEVIGMTRSKVVKNVFENSTLAALRDTLLPKLISGELRVPDAEKFVEPACAGTADRKAGL